MTEEELAELAEVEPAFVRRVVRAGALAADGPDGFGPQDASRLRFLRAWDAAGLPVEAIADLVRRGELPLSFLLGPTVDPHPRLASTYQELSAQRGVGLATLQRLHHALGFGPPAPTDRARADDLLMVELLEQLVEAGAEQDLLERGGAAGARLPPLFGQILVAVYRRHRQHVWLDHSIGHVERILEANGLYRRLERPPCVCFVDLTGYTRLTAERGDEAAADRIPRPNRLEPLGPVELKGVAQPLEVFRALA